MKALHPTTPHRRRSSIANARRALAGACWAALLSFCSVSTPATAPEILAATGIRGGLIVHLGCGDGTLTAGLRGGDGCVVQGLDADSGKKLTELKLSAPPVWDGMAAASNTLYVSTMDGHIVALTGQ